MKKSIFLAIILAAGIFTHASAFDIKDALKKVGGSTDIGSIVGNVLSSGNIEVSDLVGHWSYSAPAVTFKSDNLLQKAGGAAAAATITSKLEPIYSKTGIDKLDLNIAADSTFEMKVRGITLKGSISKNTDEASQANFIFNFTAGKIKIGKINAYVEKNPLGGIKLMFDVTKLIELVKTVGSVTGNSTINTLSKALSSYDGLCAGFELKSSGR